MAARIFKRTRDGVDEYWTGDMDGSEPVVSPHRCDAYHFKTSATALTVAETHPFLRDSDEWKMATR